MEEMEKYADLSWMANPSEVRAAFLGWTKEQHIGAVVGFLLCANKLAQEFNEIQGAALSKYGGGTHWVSGGYPAHWPAAVKETMRKVYKQFYTSQKAVILHYKASGKRSFDRDIRPFAVMAGGYGFGNK